MRDKRPSTDEIEDVATARGREMVGERAGRGSLIGDGGVRPSELVEALADERRRFVLYYLRDSGTTELDELIEQVAARETGTSPGALSDQTRRNVRISLYHVHLPKLEASGIIGYDRRQGLVCFRSLPAPVEEFLDYCETIDTPEPSDRPE